MDFWTIIFQIVNFIIFAGILHHLLYRPVKTMMEKRRETMESQLEEARQERQQADELKQEAQEQQQELDEKSDRILQDAREQAEEEKQKILKQADSEARKQIAQFRRSLNRERRETIEALVRDLNGVVLAALSTLLTQEGFDLNDAALDRLEKQLESLDDSQRQQAREAIAQEEQTITVVSASELGEKQQKRLKTILTSAFELDKVDLSLDTDSGLVGGLEVTVGSLQVQAHWRQPLQNVLEQELKSLHQNLQDEEQNENAEDKPAEETEPSDTHTEDNQSLPHDDARLNKDNA